jgi:predicted transcriptional regulator
MAKDNIFRLVLSKEDKDALMEIAEEERTSASALVRKLIADFIKGHNAIDKK